MLINTVTPSELPRKPWENTLIYFPFSENANDVMGNATLSWWTYTKQNIWYLCAWTSWYDTNNINTSSAISSQILTLSSWVNVQYAWPTSWTRYCQILLMWNGNVCYQYSVSSWTANAFQVYKSNRTYSYLWASLPTNEWHLLTLTTSSTATICYIDTTPYVVASSWWYYNEWNWLRLWRSWTQVIHSNVIWESRIRGFDDITKYYNQTKSKYWIS